ncbi:MAG: MFS transporter [Bacteroidales bacterium]
MRDEAASSIKAALALTATPMTDVPAPAAPEAVPMMGVTLLPSILTGLPPDARLLFATRVLRLFGYGLISIVLVLYLSQLGFTTPQVGLLLTLTLVGDTVISLALTTTADQIGRKITLITGALLVVTAGVVFGITRHYWLLLLAATVGVISPSGNEVGPFLAIEQAALSQVTAGRDRTAVFAWYQLLGALATAVGALVGGGSVSLLQQRGWTALASFRAVIAGYAAIGAALATLCLCLSPAVEVRQAVHRQSTPVLLGLHKSRRVVFQLSALFSLDAFAGGFVVQSIAAYWFHIRFGVAPSTLGAIFFGANLLAAVSALVAAPLSRRIGLIPTMVVTHLPSNVLLILVPLMPTLPLAVAMLLLRFSISQMDVPTRQAYTMAVVDPDERSAAAGVTGVARTAGAAVSPSLAGLLLAVPALISVPFFLSGSLKVAYDLLLWRGFRSRHPSEF